MSDQRHRFETIQRWGELSENDLISALNESGANAVLTSTMELLTNKTVDLTRYSINELAELVKKLRQLIRSGSWELGESIIKSTKLAKAENLDKAIYEMNKFKSSSNSPF